MTKLLAFICAALLLPMTGCDNFMLFDAFDADMEGIVDVVTEALVVDDTENPDGEQPERNYYTVATGQRVQSTAPFAPEDMTVYTVRLASKVIQDDQGNRVPENGVLESILAQLEALHKSFFRVKIFEVDGEYFPYVELNVNLWDPCRLYYYDQARDALVELNTWDAEEIIGLRLRSLDNIGN